MGTQAIDRRVLSNVIDYHLPIHSLIQVGILTSLGGIEELSISRPLTTNIGRLTEIERHYRAMS